MPTTYAIPNGRTVMDATTYTGQGISTPTTISGYGITDAVSTGGSYANPSWITSLAWSKITTTPTTLAGYGITDAVPQTRNLTINGTTYDLSADRTWTISAMSNPMTTAGDMIYGGVSGTPTRLGIGTNEIGRAHV